MLLNSERIDDTGLPICTLNEGCVVFVYAVSLFDGLTFFVIYYALWLFNDQITGKQMPVIIWGQVAHVAFHIAVLNIHISLFGTTKLVVSCKYYYLLLLYRRR